MAYNYEYPYTDVHRHNDDWMINRVKELSLEWLKTQQEWNNTQEEFTSLKTFIQNYFAELDVQDEVNTKLDIMARDGSLSALISPLFSEYKKEIDRTMSEQNGNISILKARMDAFTALSEGSTTGDAELTDGRVDYKGNVHANIGEHIREVSSQLSGEIVHYNALYCINKYEPTMETSSQNGVTLTKNSDNTYTLSGTTTEQTTFNLGLYHFEPSTMILSGCPNTNGNTRLYFVDGVYDIGEGAVYGIGGTVDLPLYFWIAEGVNCNGLSLKPMLEHGTVAHNYTPHKKPLNLIGVIDANSKCFDNYSKYKTVINYKTDFNGQNGIFFGDSVTEGITSVDGSIIVTPNNYVKSFANAVNLASYTNRGLRGQAYSIGTKFEDYIRNTDISTYDYLFLAGGVNDWANGIPLITFKYYVNSCFDYIKTLPNLKDVFIICPINFASTQYSGGDSHITDINEYRQILFESAINHGFSFIDTTSFNLFSSIGNSEFLGEPLWYKQFSDGLHPTEIGYYIYGKELAKAITSCPILDDVYLQGKSNFTGKYWYDTNAIFRYVLVDTLSGSAVEIPATGFDANAIMPLKIDGWIKRPSDNIKFPIGYTEPDGSTYIKYKMLNGSFYLYTSNDFVGGEVNLIFEYTRGR